MSRGGSELRAYASYGGAGIGKLCTHFELANWLPSQFYSMNMMGLQEVYAFPSFESLVVTLVISRIQSHGDAGDVLVGGWSLGTQFAFGMALKLESSLRGPRGVFALDIRGLLPWVQGSLSTASMRLQTNAYFESVSKWRFCAEARHFVCPMDYEKRYFLDDHAISSRTVLYTKVVEVVILPTSTHDTIGLDHGWDIARHLRSSFSRRNVVVHTSSSSLSGSFHVPLKVLPRAGAACQ